MRRSSNADNVPRRAPQTTASKPKAYSYVRFSTPEQELGDSYRRQADLAKFYADKHGLELDTTLRLDDRGVSAYQGRNATVGALGAFRKAVIEGEVPQGSYLIVESLALLWQIYSRRFSVPNHFRQCGHRFDGS
jgi:DNA invertase Pin-like site-specific DNA recombinase